MAKFDIGLAVQGYMAARQQRMEQERLAAEQKDKAARLKLEEARTKSDIDVAKSVQKWNDLRAKQEGKAQPSQLVDLISRALQSGAPAETTAAINKMATDMGFVSPQNVWNKTEIPAQPQAQITSPDLGVTFGPQPSPYAHPAIGAPALAPPERVTYPEYTYTPTDRTAPGQIFPTGKYEPPVKPESAYAGMRAETGRLNYLLNRDRFGQQVQRDANSQAMRSYELAQRMASDRDRYIERMSGMDITPEDRIGIKAQIQARNESIEKFTRMGDQVLQPSILDQLPQPLSTMGNWNSFGSDVAPPSPAPPSKQPATTPVTPSGERGKERPTLTAPVHLPPNYEKVPGVTRPTPQPRPGLPQLPSKPVTLATRAIEAARLAAEKATDAATLELRRQELEFHKDDAKIKNEIAWFNARKQTGAVSGDATVGEMVHKRGGTPETIRQFGFSAQGSYEQALGVYGNLIQQRLISYPFQKGARPVLLPEGRKLVDEFNRNVKVKTPTTKGATSTHGKFTSFSPETEANILANASKLKGRGEKAKDIVDAAIAKHPGWDRKQVEKLVGIAPKGK